MRRGSDSVLDTPLGHHALFIGVLDLLHLVYSRAPSQADFALALGSRWEALTSRSPIFQGSVASHPNSKAVVAPIATSPSR